MRKYEPIWNALRDKQTATVTCHETAQATLVQAVKKEKSRQNTLRKRLGMPAFGELNWTSSKASRQGFVKIVFTIAYSGDAL